MNAEYYTLLIGIRVRTTPYTGSLLYEKESII